MAEKSGNRWLIAIMGTVLQITLGTIYAWSFFQNPLIDNSKEIAGVTEITANIETAKATLLTSQEALQSAETALQDALSLNQASAANLETVKADAGKKPTKAKLEMITAAESQLAASETAMTEANTIKANAETAVKTAEETITTEEAKLTEANKKVWNNSQVAWILSFSICFLGIGAMIGGFILPKFGPRKLAVTGAVLYGLGWILGGIALGGDNPSLPFLYIGLGVIGGIGLGLGYVTPVATAAKWFPDKKGFITGMVVMGFGLGALFMSKVFAPVIMDMFTTDGVTDFQTAFIVIGLVLGIPGIIAGLTFQNPPAGYVPEGYTPPAATASSNAQGNLTVKESIMSGPFWKIWFFFFCNITAGIMFIGFQSPLLQDLLKKQDGSLDKVALAASGATLIAISSLFNGIGRFFWGGLSDKIGRAQAFRLILGTQLVVFLLLMVVSSPIIFSILVCYILLCYGGGFGTAPSFVMTVFGPKVMAVVYGTLLTAWSMGGLVGPQIAAYFKDSNPATAANNTFLAGAVFLLAGLIVAFMTNNKEYGKN
ncbi:MAG TPA: MFS transporter [Clostridiales bacterium]|nr:MFS transporter [Clostridiales bacterium]HQP69763.1 MFS transporter [Clostridiales bacterium]